MEIRKVGIAGVSSEKDILEFINAVEYYKKDDSGAVKVYESKKGTVEAYANILKQSNDVELKKTLIRVFYKYGCRFNASWMVGDLNSSYKAIIDFTTLPVFISNDIIKASKRLDRELAKAKRKIR